VSDADVVVVGAGVAGLACARHLLAAGRQVAVFESGDRPGGRVRTDVVDGHLLDRGFQVHDTGYPEPQRYLAGLTMHPFTTGARVHDGERFHLVADPRRHPQAALSSARAPIGSALDKARAAAYLLTTLRTDPRQLIARPDTRIADALRAAGVGSRMVEALWRPLLAGITGDWELETSTRFVELVLRCQGRGRQVLPAGGMGDIPARLARGVDVTVDSAVEHVDAGSITVGGRRITARHVVVATEPAAAQRLLGLPAVPMRSLATVFHTTTEDPGYGAAICLGGRGPITSSVTLSNVNPAYAPPGRHLVATSVAGALDLPAVGRQLRAWFGSTVETWEELAVVEIAQAIVAFTPGQPLRRPSTLQAGLHVCGDHRATPSLQGAMVSGRHCAQEILSS
jgi:hypothetical protein